MNGRLTRISSLAPGGLQVVKVLEGGGGDSGAGV